MDTGSICADIKPVENKRVGFTVKTPAVTASVRGTAGYVYAYGKVEAIRGKWGLSAPLPKEINYDRGDVGERSDKPNDRPESSSPAVSEQPKADAAEQVEETNESEATTSETPSSSNDESASQETSTSTSSDTSMEMEEVDVEIDSMIAGANADSEIFVSAGEVAYVNPVQSDVIVTPVEVKKENATNNNVDLSKLENKVIEDFANIIVEIVIPE